MEQMELEKKLWRNRRFFGVYKIQGEEGQYLEKKNISGRKIFVGGLLDVCIQKAKEGMESRT